MFFFIAYIKHVKSISVISDILYYHSSYYSEAKLDNDLIINHADLYEELRDLLGTSPNQKNNLYLLNMFISWFAFVIPLNIARNKKLSSSEKRNLLNNMFDNDKFIENLKILNKVPEASLKTKFILFLLKLKSSYLLLNFVRIGGKVPREKMKKIMKN